MVHFELDEQTKSFWKYDLSGFVVLVWSLQCTSAYYYKVNDFVSEMEAGRTSVAFGRCGLLYRWARPPYCGPYCGELWFHVDVTKLQILPQHCMMIAGRQTDYWLVTFVFYGLSHTHIRHHTLRPDFDYRSLTEVRFVLVVRNRSPTSVTDVRLRWRMSDFLWMYSDYSSDWYVTEARLRFPTSTSNRNRTLITEIREVP